MIFTAFIFFLVCAVALLRLPRRWAPLPLLAGACYMTLGQGIEVGPFSLPIIRMLLLVGFIRVIMRNERPAGGFAGMDWLMLVWATWALSASALHTEFASTLVNRLGMVYNTLGVYFLIRCFCRDEADVFRLVRMTAILLVPVAIEMLLEHLTYRNLFAVFGGVSPEPEIRNGRLRAQGPFAHSILAGTVGAVCIPLMIGIWRRHPRAAKMGLAACLLMVFASSSSGPIMSVVFGVFALVLWRWRRYTRLMRIGAVAGYILLEIVMNAPAYYLIARIDLTGGSTGYHRARLIQSAIEHLDEWWLAGTDFTRHWTATGVPWSEDHADITNHYLAQGVRGGLPLLLLFIMTLVFGFRYVGQALRRYRRSPKADQFLIWALGSSLFAHTATAVSVAYFDQTVLFLYTALAMIASLRTGVLPEPLSAREHVGEETTCAAPARAWPTDFPAPSSDIPSSVERRATGW